MRLTSAGLLFCRGVAIALISSLGLAMGGLAVGRPAAAQTEIDITRGVLEPRPIAVPLFEGARADDAALGREVADVIAGNLERSGLFRPLDRAAFIDRVTVDRAPNFADWRIINAETVVVGRVGQLPDGRVQADFRLWDVFQGRQLAGQQFVTTRANLRRIGHLISDVVYERLTGEKGYFDSRIVFIDETGPKNKRVKRLAVMDSDGANVRTLTTGEDLVLTPRFSPSSQEIAYMSYEGGRPRVRLLNIDTRQSELVADASNMTFAPRFSPDGQRIVLSLQDGGNANIYEMDLRTQALTRLTTTPAIDTAPSYSPDGRQIVFESDRDGTQQLYVMNADGSNQQRISFGDGRYSTPVWSPRGDLIAFTKKTSSFFVIGVMRPDGTGERIITEGFHNEGPTWSPNGRVIMFFREQPGADGGPQIFSVDLTGYNERQVATPGFASDPAWSPILK